MISKGKLVYHKSAKKYTHHLFEWTDEYSGSFSGGNLSAGVTTHVGLKEARKSILSLFDRYEPKLINWFDKANTIENLVSIAEGQFSIKKHYDIHHPNPVYVLAFLYAKTNQIDKAIKMIESLNGFVYENNEEIKQRLMEKMLALKG